MAIIFKDCESYSIVKKLLTKSKPQNIAVKCKVEDKVLLAVNNDFTLFFLNDVAGEFLLLCNGKNTFEEIYLKLIDKYDCDEEVLVNDLMATIRDLQKKMLLYIDPLEVLA